MSDLQLGLIAIGVAIVVAVLVYNRWQERRYRRQAEASFAQRHEDVLLGAQRERPRGAPTTGQQRTEPVLAAERAEVVVSPPPQEELTESVDFVVPVEAADEIDLQALLAAAREALADTTRPIRWEGFNESAQRWETLRSDAGYCLVRAGLQLVDRRGAVSAEELALFSAGIQQAAAASGALAAVPDPQRALVQAEELDRFCDEVDVRIALHLVSATNPFTGTKVRALAEAAGLRLDDGQGCFRRTDEEGRVLFTLSNLEPEPLRSDNLRTLLTRGLTLELDVPRAPPGAFKAMRELTAQLAQALGAQIVDDNRQPLSSTGFEKIESQLRAIHSTMQARGIAPGERLALRLFS